MTHRDPVVVRALGRRSRVVRDNVIHVTSPAVVGGGARGGQNGQAEAGERREVQAEAPRRLAPPGRGRSRSGRHRGLNATSGSKRSLWERSVRETWERSTAPVTAVDNKK